MQEQKTFPGLSSFTLHILAMALMFCDHLKLTLAPETEWLTWVGRLAFPIFAFLLVEGYYHTHDLKKYMLRLLAAALITEIPFNYMTGGGAIFPYHQNVLFTFLLGLLAIAAIDSVRKKRGDDWVALLTAFAVALASAVLGNITFVDYYAAGPLTVLVFYLFRGSLWWQRLGQFAGLFWINFVLLAGYSVPVTLLGCTFDFPRQGAAIFALLFIWLYKGRQGPHGRGIQAVYYLFYPAHILLLVVLSYLLV